MCLLSNGEKNKQTFWPTQYIYLNLFLCTWIYVHIYLSLDTDTEACED